MCRGFSREQWRLWFALLISVPAMFEWSVDCLVLCPGLRKHEVAFCWISWEVLGGRRV